MVDSATLKPPANCLRKLSLALLPLFFSSNLQEKRLPTTSLISYTLRLSKFPSAALSSIAVATDTG